MDGPHDVSICAWIVEMGIEIGVSTQTMDRFFVGTIIATVFTTVDTGIVKGRVKRAKVASAAVPRDRHSVGERRKIEIIQ